MKIRAALLILFCAVSFGPAQAGSSNGTATAEFLTLGIGARSTAMGEAYSALGTDATTLFWNPASLTQIPSASLSLMHAAYLDSSNFSYASFAKNFGKAGAWGASLHYFSAGDITQTDINGADVGSFKPNDRAISLGYGILLNGFAMGASLKQIHSKITQSASTISADVGLLSPAYLHERLKLALTGRNLFGGLKYRSIEEDLPTEYRLGAGYFATPRWTMSLDAAFPKNSESYQALGTEYVFGSQESLAISGRAGYNTRSDEVDGFSGFSFGAGFGFNKVNLDYAIVPFGDLGTTHRFSLSVNF